MVGAGGRRAGIRVVRRLGEGRRDGPGEEGSRRLVGPAGAHEDAVVWRRRSRRPGRCVAERMAAVAALRERMNGARQCGVESFQV